MLEVRAVWKQMAQTCRGAWLKQYQGSSDHAGVAVAVARRRS